MSSTRLNAHVFVDFDGTIAVEDTTDRLLERFAAPEWQAIEEEWKAGRIGSRECMVRQISLVRATPAELTGFFQDIAIDGAFPEFVRHCRGQGYGMTVVSDGLDFGVNAVLKRVGVDLPVRANHLKWLGDDRWALTFPHARSDCSTLAGNCKCQFAASHGTGVSIVVGDGRSDFCVAARADFVLAKASLLTHCMTNALPHVAFRDFAEARELLSSWVAARAIPAAHKPAQ